jgi:hypothetical protein
VGHTHDHAVSESYYLEQLCSIGFCGALGVVQLLLWLQTSPDDPEVPAAGLRLILDQKFHLPVLISGIALTALALLRGLSLWVAVGRAKAIHGHTHSHDCAHSHDHVHEHDCAHDHDHEHTHEHANCCHEHSHDHVHDHEHIHGPDGDADHEHSHVHADCGHDHGWAPWRYAVLLVPLLLFLLGMPRPAAAINEEPLPKGVTLAHFKDVYYAAFDQGTQNFLDGKPVRVRGMFHKLSDNQFYLFRLKMTCCAADGYPVNILVTYNPGKNKDKAEPMPVFETGQWVNVIGLVHFQQLRGRSEYTTVLEVRAPNDVTATNPDPNPFLN